MRYLVVIGLCLAGHPIAALGDDGECLLRLTRHGYENTARGPTKPVDKELDAVDLTITPGIPFGVVTRLESRTIKFSGIVRRKQDSDLFVLNFHLSWEVDEGPLKNIREVNTAVEVPTSKPLEIAGLIYTETGGDGRKIETRTNWTLELTK
jgi:hypothetical protein